MNRCIYRESIPNYQFRMDFQFHLRSHLAILSTHFDYRNKCNYHLLYLPSLIYLEATNWITIDTIPILDMRKTMQKLIYW
jgi:hypothetical protein